MKGWVYVISNKSMPGLVKIGFTMKDPELRASELNGTGVPTPYVVDYEALVEEPRVIEGQVHVGLAEQREGKEWFRMSAESAIAGIKSVVGNSASLENYKRTNRQKSEQLARLDHQKLLATQAADQQKKRSNRSITNTKERSTCSQKKRPINTST